MSAENTTEKKGLWSQIWVYGLIVVAVFILYFYIAKPIEETIAAITGEIIIITLSALVAVIFFVVAHQFKWTNSRTGQVAILISVAFILWAIAEAIYFYFDQTLPPEEIPFPSSADYFYIIGYIPIAIALLLNIRTIKIKFKPTIIALWIIISAIILGLIIWFEVIPFLAPTLDAIVSISYPLLDTLIIVLALVILLKFRAGEIAKPWLLIAIGFILDAIGDIWFTYVEAYSESVPVAYNLYDLFFSLSYLAVFAGGVYLFWLYRGH